MLSSVLPQKLPPIPNPLPFTIGDRVRTNSTNTIWAYSADWKWESELAVGVELKLLDVVYQNEAPSALMVQAEKTSDNKTVFFKLSDLENNLLTPVTWGGWEFV